MVEERQCGSRLFVQIPDPLFKLRESLFFPLG
jgi:hypothetical protein